MLTQALAEKLCAVLVQNAAMATPFTVGVFGAWGSGKTSLLTAVSASPRTALFSVFFLRSGEYVFFFHVLKY